LNTAKRFSPSILRTVTIRCSSRNTGVRHVIAKWPLRKGRGGPRRNRDLRYDDDTAARGFNVASVSTSIVAMRKNPAPAVSAMAGPSPAARRAPDH